MLWRCPLTLSRKYSFPWPPRLFSWGQNDSHLLQSITNLHRVLISRCPPVILPETKWFFYCRSESDKKLMRAIKQLLASILPDRSKGAFDDRWGDSACAFIITVEHHQPFFFNTSFCETERVFWGGCLCSFYKSDQNWTNYQPLWHLILIYLWLIFYAELWWIYLPPRVSSAVSATPGWLWWTEAAGVKIQSI